MTRVGIDLRGSGKAAAVAIDARGRVKAWALATGDSNPGQLAKQALRKLSVRPKKLRILLGTETAQTGVFMGGADPRQDQVVETLLAEGYEPLAAPAVATISITADESLVAACSEDQIDILARGAVQGLAIEPTFVVDQLFLAQLVDIGSAAVECGEEKLSIVASPYEGVPVMRSLATGADTIGEVEKTLRAAGVERVRVFGVKREDLSEDLERLGFEVDRETLPSGLSPDAMPADLELAWCLALEDSPPELHGARLEKRHRSLLLGRRVAWAGMALWLLSIVVFAYALMSWWSQRARHRAFQAENAVIQGQVRRVRETIVLAREIQALRAELAKHDLPWPRLGETLSALSDQESSIIAWDRLAVVDGNLEIEALASGPIPFRDLEFLRRALEETPGVVNLSWDEPIVDERGQWARQTFRAKVHDVRKSDAPKSDSPRSNGDEPALDGEEAR